MPFRRKRLIHPSSATPGEAIQYLASICDGAIKRDGLGFASNDAVWGHHLANRDETTWTRDERFAAMRLVRIYQHQLANAGYNPHAILTSRQAKCSQRSYDKYVAGWFADPTGFSPWRYWNGCRWTHHLTNTLQRQDGQLIS